MSDGRDARGDVLALLRQTGGLSTEQIVEALRQAHDERAVTDALAELSRELEVVQDADGNWWLR